EDQLLDQGHRLVAGGGTVVTGHQRMHAFRDMGGAQALEAGGDGGGDVGGVGARLLGDGDSDGRVAAAVGPDVPGIAGGQVGAAADLGDVGEVERAASGRADDRPGHQMRGGAGGDAAQ